MITLRFITILFFEFVCSVLAFSDEAFDFYVQACRHSGYNPAEVVTFQAEVTIITKQTMSDSIVEELVRKMADSLETELKGMDEVQKQKIIEEHIEQNRRQFSGYITSRSLKAFVKNSVATVGLEGVPARVLQIDLANKNSYLFSIDTRILPSGVNPCNFERQMDISQSGSVTTIGKGRYSGIEYHLAGRTQSVGTISNIRLLLSRNDGGGFSFSDAGIAAFKKNCENNERTFALSKERVKYEGDYSAHILEVYEKKVLCERFWIDPDRGYICPKEQSYNSYDGKVMCEVVSEKFILDEHSMKWFPEKSVCMMQMGEGMESVVEIHITPGTLVLNQPIPDSTFSITVQEGMRVDDFRRDDNDKITFFANQTDKLDLPTVENQKLDNIYWLSPREVAQPYEPPPVTKSSFGWTRVLGMAIGIIMIIAALYRLYYAKNQ